MNMHWRSKNPPHYPGSGRGPFILAVLDVAATVFGLLFVCMLALCIPLAVFLMALVAF